MIFILLHLFPFFISKYVSAISIKMNIPLLSLYLLYKCDIIHIYKTLTFLNILFIEH